MTTSRNQPPIRNSSAWNWPAEWAAERTFWREVGSRTVAGVLTIIVLAIPGLVYATIFGLLTLDKVTPILFGIALFGVVLGAYIFVLNKIRRSESEKIASALAKDEPRSELTLSPEDFMSYSAEERKREMSKLSPDIQEGVREAERRARLANKWSTIAALIGSIAGVVVTVLFALYVPRA